MAESGLESGHSPSTLGVALQSLEGAMLGDSVNVIGRIIWKQNLLACMATVLCFF